MRFSEHSEELRDTRIEYITDRWKQLAELERAAATTAATYLMVTNSGGAIAVLSFMGAMKTTTPFANAPAMLLSFVTGVVLVGVGRAAAYYRLANRYRRWREGVRKFYRDETNWHELIADDEAQGWRFPIGDVIAWAAFGCFVTGLLLGFASLP